MMNRLLRRLAAGSFGFFSRVFAWYAILAFVIAMNHGIKAEAGGTYWCSGSAILGSGGAWSCSGTHCILIWQTCTIDWIFATGNPTPIGGTCTCQ